MSETGATSEIKSCTGCGKEALAICETCEGPLCADCVSGKFKDVDTCKDEVACEVRVIAKLQFGEKGLEMNPDTGCISNEGLAARDEKLAEMVRTSNALTGVEVAGLAGGVGKFIPAVDVNNPPPAVPTKEALQKLAEEFKKKFSSKGLRMLPDGGIALEVTIDVDLAGSLLAWAQGAGEDPATFIQSQIREALLAYTGA